MTAEKASSERIPPRRTMRGRCVGGIVFLSSSLVAWSAGGPMGHPPRLILPPQAHHPPWGEQHGASPTRGHPVEVEPGKSLVSGSTRWQGQTPRAGRGSAPSDAAGSDSHPCDRRRSRECRRGFGDSSRSDRLRTGRRWPRSRRRPPEAGRPRRRRPGPGGSHR